MSEHSKSPYDILPHGPGLHFLGEQLESMDGALSFLVPLTTDLSVVGPEGAIQPEVGLEIMAQACGMLLSTETSLDAGTLGVVAAVRGYEYSSEPFLVGQTLIVTVRPVMLEGELAVCEGELCEQQGGSVLQRARITLVCRKEDS